ncbi:hypothetical protein PV387_04625 [Streptomyces sp. ME02-6987-2C]|uniref:hypothetical protein n=1 Tax=unclassified Streptomyces TaxID=2593676 RepID=UPI0011C118A2|nr:MULTISPECIES: hypothetical protein [unclassified Streptomyces]MDX3365316.1 hypothetical protein [Streptomyces sp. ME02-6987-2C]MDX3422687.1 hypothetical protein [Streptomyces sp. ME02-6985-2c]
MSEQVEGRQYVVDTVTHLGPGGPEHTVTGIWAHLHTLTGLLDRTDLFYRHDLLARRLSLYVCQVLDTLGVISGPMSCQVAFEPEHGPVLVSAGIVTHRSRADEVVWDLAGYDPIDTALGGVLMACRGSGDYPRRRVARICVNAQQRDASGPSHLQVLAALPTTRCVDVDPSPFISGSGVPLLGGETCEIVLSHETPKAIERDYHRIQALMVDLHRIRR